MSSPSIRSIIFFAAITIALFIEPSVAASYKNGTVPVGTWPKLAKSYTATVSTNFNHTGRGFYTLAYTEAYDDNLHLYRAQGRFYDSHYVELFFLRAGVVFTFDDRYPDTTCNFTAIDLYTRTQQNISLWAIDRFNYQNSSKIFQGNNSLPGSITVRDLNYEIWNLSMTANPLDRAILYMRLDVTPEEERVPLRLVRHYNETLNGVSYDVTETTDWTNYVMGAPSPLLFKYPAQCSNSDPSQLQSRIVLPSVVANAQNSLQAASSKLPDLQQQFTVTLEAKLEEKPGEERIHTIVWAVDVPSNRERIDVYAHLEEDEPDSPMVIRSWFFQYAPNTLWGTVGTVHYGFLDAYATKYSSCTVNPVSEANQSPLLSLRAGSIPSVFGDPAFLNKNLNSFVGTEMIRGVPADTYKFTKSVTRGGRTHNFDMEVGFIPKGWNFPGRQALSGISVPLHFRNTGNVTTNGVTQGYKDNWDLFLYVPGQPPASRFDPAELGCVFVPPPTAAPAPPLSVTTVVVSAVVGAVVGAILASGTAFYCWRQWRINNPPPVEHKPLPTTELSSMPADAHVPATPHSEATNV